MGTAPRPHHQTVWKSFGRAFVEGKVCFITASCTTLYLCLFFLNLIAIPRTAPGLLNVTVFLSHQPSSPDSAPLLSPPLPSLAQAALLPGDALYLFLLPRGCTWEHPPALPTCIGQEGRRGRDFARMLQNSTREE